MTPSMITELYQSINQESIDDFLSDYYKAYIMRNQLRDKRIKALNTLLSYVMFFSNVINLKTLGKTIRNIKLQLKGEIKFWLYRVSEGIKV